MLRSAIINATLMAAARRSLSPSSATKASLSTLSFNTLSIEDACRNSDNCTYTPAMSASNSFTTNIKSSVCNLIANLSGDVTFVSLDQTQSQIEEENWGDANELSNLSVLKEDDDEGISQSLSVWLISTLKRRKKMMNKHKLRKRRKKLRLKTRK